MRDIPQMIAQAWDLRQTRLAEQKKLDAMEAEEKELMTQIIANWEALLLHCLYPDYNPFPEILFLLPIDQLPHYKLLLKALDDIYNAYTEE